TNNSKFEGLNPVNNATAKEFVDSIDTTTVTLTSESTNDGKDIKISVSLSNIDGMDTKVTNTPLVITLNDGTKITIPVGETTGNITVPNPAPNGGVVTYSISKTTGGNYEALDKNSTTTIVTKDIVPPTVTITGSTVSESNTGTVTGNKTIGTVTISFNKPLTEDLTITLNNGQKIDFKVGDTTKTVEVETSRVDDAYKQGTTTETVSIASTSNSKIDITDKTATIAIKDDVDPVDVTITATATAPKILDVNTDLGKQTGVTIFAESDNGKAELVSIKGTNHDGFGVLTTDKKGNSVNKSNGDTKEIGVGERVIVEFDKDVNSLDVAFAWRNNGEVARITFKDNGQVVGYAEIKGGGSSTLAKVEYYDKDGKFIKSLEAQGGTDKVDLSYTFELSDANGNLVSFDRAEFSAPNTNDDYLIHSIAYKEVVNPGITDIVTKGGQVTFNIQIDEKYPPQGKATATVVVNDKTYEVPLNATGRGTLTIDAKNLGDLSKVEVKVVEVKGGNYEAVNQTQGNFDFITSANGEKLESSDDKINVVEDTPYTLKITDFGDNLSVNTREFKITELPKNGTLYKTITQGETYFDKEGNKTVATKDTKVPVTKDQVISLADVGVGKVVFVPNENTDDNGNFKFQVGDGKGNFSNEYTTTIEVKAVADAPTVSINITPNSDNPTSTGNNGNAGSNGNNGNSNGIGTKPNIEISNDWWKGLKELSKEDVINDTPTYKVETIDWSNKPKFTSGNDIVNIGTLTSSSNGIDTGAGDDRIYISENIENNGSNIITGAGNDTVLLAKDVKSNVDLGSGDDKLDIKGNLESTIYAGSGNDEIFIKGSASQNSTIDLGEGNNKLHVKGDVGKLTGYSGNDTVLVEGNTTNTVNLGVGNNELHVKGNAGSTITTGSGDDKVFIEGNTANTVNLGDGNNLLHVKGNAGSTITTGTGNDKVFIEGNAENSINLGSGNNQLHIKGSAKNTIDSGSGDDIVIVDGDAKNSVRLGSGNNELYIKGNAVDITTGSGIDKVIIDGSVSNYVTLGAGDDYLEIGGKLTQNNTYLDGGDGIDTLYLRDYTKQEYESDFVANYQTWRIKNFETITFKDGDTYKIDNNGNLGDKIEAKEYKYDITVSAKLTDTDGSEKLSDVTLKNIPDGSKLFGADGKEINSNDDGSYTVKVDANGEAKLSLTNEKEVSDTDLNSIKASATSTESSNGDSAATTATKDTISFDGTGDIDLSNLKNITEINLDNGKENKLSLTLDDVLKISGDDNMIKISGDKFDSVALKNEDGKAWEKQTSPITENNKTFDVYTNSGDPTVQVKIEQPISDGITN
ncbi:immunoglobulin-like domain-containing protein, partial [Aliarcobacter cryaerophilus]|uniref:immunoglobulin-like domain-containing protein n=1 Tax=Aliarcobacter cryaerophilus TaxID=28198 RepID=UPI0021B62DCE